MTFDQLSKIMPLAKHRAAFYLVPLNATMEKFAIDTPARQSSFLAQIAHESGQLMYVKELASGIAYEGRLDLGNTSAGDGVRFRGRGLLQITGRANYAACGAALGMDLILHPEMLERPWWATMSAGWFWSAHGLNQLADKGDQAAVTRRINGGNNGLKNRLALYSVASRLLA